MPRGSRRKLRRAGAISAALLLVCAPATPSRASPVLSAELGLDTPVLLRSGLGAPTVVREGADYLVLYGDDKGAASSKGPFAARIGDDGSVVDPLGLLVPGVPLGRLVPGKKSHLMVVDGPGSWAPWGGDIYAARIGPGAVPLDLAPFVVAGGPTSQFEAAAAPLADGWVVAWHDLGPPHGIFVARVSETGAVLDPGGLAIDPWPVNQLVQRPAVASNGDTALVVWEEPLGYDVLVRGVRLQQSGKILDVDPITISPPSGCAYWPAVAADGDGWLVVWKTLTKPVYGSCAPNGFPDGFNGLVARRIGADGTPSGPPVAVAKGTLAEAPALALSAGDGYLVAWAVPGSLRLARISKQGAVAPPDGAVIASSVGYDWRPQGACGPAHCLLVWSYLSLWSYDAGQSPPYGAALVAHDGTVLATPLVSKRWNAQETPYAGYAAGSYLLAWQDTRGKPLEVDLYELRLTLTGARATPDGTLVDPAGLPLAEGGGMQGHALSASADRHLLVWRDTKGAQNKENVVRAMRLATDGAVLDPGGLVVSQGFAHDSFTVASDGANWLVAAQRRKPYGDDKGIVVAHVGAAGEVNTAYEIPPPPAAGAGTPRLAYGAGQYLLVYLVAAYKDVDPEGLLAVRLTAKGTPIDPKPILLEPAAAPHAPVLPVVTYDGESFFVAWLDCLQGQSGCTAEQVRARRLAPSGQLLDATPIDVDASAARKGPPQILFGGYVSLVAWQREQAPGWSLRGAWFDHQGTRLSPAEIEIASFDPSADPFKSAPGFSLGTDGAASWLVGYARSDPQLDHGPVRGRLRLVRYGTLEPGAACTADDDCTTGHCTDGVCCDSACGGEGSGDCQACAVAAGAAHDGECSALGDGTPCDDADACTSGEHCVAGACGDAAPVTCAPQGDCQVAASCEPAAGCVYAAVPDGASCTGGVCLGGKCKPPAADVDAGADAGSADGGSTSGSGEPTGPQWTAAGGCACTLPSRPGRPAGAGARALLLLAGCALLRARRGGRPRQRWAAARGLGACRAKPARARVWL
ncbi:MAG: hypothetical protein HY744_25535 [Deltaproteobacteria bacterium]|nr:hypothetical protein [Deltaproteobacteria bacterium]